MADAVSKLGWDKLRTKSRQSLPDFLTESDDSLPAVLLPHQQAAVAAIDANEVVVIEKSRRIGLTWGVGSSATLYASASRAAGGMDVLYIGYSLDMAREFIDVCAMWAKSYGLAASEVGEALFRDTKADGSSDDILAFRIVFASGFEIMALTSRPRSLRGRQGMVIIDEAAFHDALGEVLKAALALLMWGGKVVVISTHDGDLNPFNLLCEEIRKGQMPYALLKITFDDALAGGLYQRICLVQHKPWSAEAQKEWRDKIIAHYGDAADEELNVIPRHGAGAYLQAALIERAQRGDAPVLRFEREDAWAELADHLQKAEALEWCEEHLLPVLEALPAYNTYIGQDFARTGDLSDLWISQRRQDMSFPCVLLLEMRNIPYEIQKLIVFYVLARLPRFKGGEMDATGNGGYLAEVVAKRWPCVVKRMITVQWYQEITPKFKAEFEKDTLIMPRDVDVYNDHRAMRLVRGVPQIVREDQQAGKGEAKKTRKKRHGDSAIAHMLCWAASQHPEYTNPDYATPASTGLIPAAEAASTRFVDPDHSYMPYRSY